MQRILSSLRSRAVRADAFLCAAALLLACDPVRVVEPVEFRDDGCGAGRKKAKVERTCTFKPKNAAEHPKFKDTAALFDVKGSCDGTDVLDCEVTYKGCVWQATSLSTCKSKLPIDGKPDTTPISCELPPAPVIKFTQSYELPTGVGICEPQNNATQEKLDKYCRIQVFYSKQPGQTAFQSMKDKCLAQKTDDVKDKIECCVAKDPPPSMCEYITGAHSSDGGDTEAPCDASTTDLDTGSITDADADSTTHASTGSTSTGSTTGATIDPGTGSTIASTIDPGTGSTTGSTTDDSGPYTSIGSVGTDASGDLPIDDPCLFGFCQPTAGPPVFEETPGP